MSVEEESVCSSLSDAEAVEYNLEDERKCPQDALVQLHQNRGTKRGATSLEEESVSSSLSDAEESTLLDAASWMLSQGMGKEEHC